MGVTGAVGVALAIYYRDPIICFGAGSWATSAILTASNLRDARRAARENKALRDELEARV